MISKRQNKLYKHRDKAVFGSHFFWLIRKNAPLGYANREVRFSMELEFAILHIRKGYGTVRAEMHNNSELPLPYRNAILLSMPVCRNCIQASLVYPIFCEIG